MMSKHHLLLIVFVLLGKLLSAQQLIPLNESDYLRQINTQIETSKNDIKRLKFQLLLSEYWAPIDSLKSGQALQTVLASPRFDRLPRGIVDYYQGVYYSNQGDRISAKKHYETAISQLDRDTAHSDILIKALYNYAYMQVEDKGYDILVKTLTERSIPRCQAHGNIEMLAFSYTQLGLTFMSVAQLDKAEEYHKKALAELDKLPEQNTVHLLTYLNLVSNYCYKPDSRSAKIYLDKAKKLIQAYPASPHWSNYYYQEALYHTTKQDYEQALSSLEKGAKIAKEKRQVRQLHLLYFRMYNVFLMQKDYAKAKAQLEHILQENILSRESVNRKITYTQLAMVNEQLGDYQQACGWMKKSGALSDSLQQQKLLEKMNELDAVYHSQEKQQLIDKLEQEKIENVFIAKNNNLRISVLAIALVLSTVIAFLAYRTYKNEKKLNRQININYQQELLHIRQEQKNDAFQAVLQGEEQERQRIAQDLHDSMGGMMAHIRMLVSSDDFPRSQAILEKIDKSIFEMRRISRNLMPETLKNLGLEIALRELCESMSFHQFQIQFEAFNLTEDIPFQTQLAFYRITQEAISNIIKYALASNVIVQISQHDRSLTLTIEDDGIGFERDEVVQGLGLANIENRTRLINGTIDITSSTGQGTTINIECHV